MGGGGWGLFGNSMFCVALLWVMFCLFMFDFSTKTVYWNRPNSVLDNSLNKCFVKIVVMKGKWQLRSQRVYRFENDG